MTNHKKSFLNYIKLSIVGVFLLTSDAFSCVNFEFDNKAGEPAVLRKFAKNYSSFTATSDMEFDPDDKLQIFIQYQDLFKYWGTLREKGIMGFSEAEKDFIEFSVGDDAFVVYWDDKLSVSLRKTQSDTYDAKLETLPDVPTDKKYKIVITRK